MHQRVWVPYWGGVHRILMEEAHKRYLICRKVKAEYQRPHGKMQPLEIPVWKWEDITMDFITKLTQTAFGVDSIWAIMDHLTKSTYFITIQESFSAENLAVY